MRSTSAPEKFLPEMAFSAADLRVFAALETAFGDTLWPLLRAYLHDGNAASEKLQAAVACTHWQEAVRLAREIAVMAADLDFRAVEKAAHDFAASVYEANTAHRRRNGAQMLVFEFERSCLLLESRWPGLMETAGTSVA